LKTVNSREDKRNVKFDGMGERLGTQLHDQLGTDNRRAFVWGVCTGKRLSGDVCANTNGSRFIRDQK